MKIELLERIIGRFKSILCGSLNTKCGTMDLSTLLQFTFTTGCSITEYNLFSRNKTPNFEITPSPNMLVLYTVAIMLSIMPSYLTQAYLYYIVYIGECETNKFKCLIILYKQYKASMYAHHFVIK